MEGDKCPECEKYGRQSYLQFWHVNLTEDVLKCGCVDCLYPFRNFTYRASRLNEKPPVSGTNSVQKTSIQTFNSSPELSISNVINNNSIFATESIKPSNDLLNTSGIKSSKNIKKYCNSSTGNEAEQILHALQNVSSNRIEELCSRFSFLKSNEQKKEIKLENSNEVINLQDSLYLNNKILNEITKSSNCHENGIVSNENINSMCDGKPGIADASKYETIDEIDHIIDNFLNSGEDTTMEGFDSSTETLEDELKSKNVETVEDIELNFPLLSLELSPVKEKQVNNLKQGIENDIKFDLAVYSSNVNKYEKPPYETTKHCVTETSSISSKSIMDNLPNNQAVFAIPDPPQDITWDTGCLKISTLSKRKKFIPKMKVKQEKKNFISNTKYLIVDKKVVRPINRLKELQPMIFK